MTLVRAYMSNGAERRGVYIGPFCPRRLGLAREMRGLTKEELARLCGVTRRTITDWESGKVDKPPVGKVARVLDFPEAFFYGAEPDEIRPESISFRALTAMTQRQTHKVVAAASLIAAFSRWIDAEFKTPDSDVPFYEELAPSHVD